MIQDQYSTNRRKSLKWWSKMNLEQKFYIIIKHNDLIIGNCSRHPDTLTGGEIEKIWKKQKQNDL